MALSVLFFFRTGDPPPRPIENHWFSVMSGLTNIGRQAGVFVPLPCVAPHPVQWCCLVGTVALYRALRLQMEFWMRQRPALFPRPAPSQA